MAISDHHPDLKDVMFLGFEPRRFHVDDGESAHGLTLGEGCDGAVGCQAL